MSWIHHRCPHAVLVLILLVACQSYPQGRKLYHRHCASCHMEDGLGLLSLYPPLNQSDYLLQHIDQFACIVHHGMSDPITVNDRYFTTPMEGLPQLTPVEIANIFNYIAATWYEDMDPISEDEVKLQLADCLKEP